MVRRNGISVTVRVNARPLFEYTDEDTTSGDEPPTSVNRYITSTAGEQFTLSVFCRQKAFKDCSALVCDYSVDGTRVHSFYEKPGKQQHTIITGPEGYVNGVWSVQQLRFVDLEITDDNGIDERAKVEERIGSLGRISLEVFRVSNIRDEREKEKGVYDGKLSEAVPVPEKALKGQAIDTSVQLGEATPITKSNTSRCDWIDPRGKPCVTFNFKYRSRKALQSLGIIPRSPSPVPLEQRPKESLSREELLELLERREQQSNSLLFTANIKDEIGSVKRERDEEVDGILASARPAKTPRVGEIEVVDLLDD